MKKGLFITFEGGDACGKSTQVRKIREYFENKHIDVCFTREPGGTPLTEEIRKLLLNFETDKPLDMTELLLYLAARVEDVEKIIKPSLEQGKIVIADRFYDSTIAYQGNARGIMSAEDILFFTKKTIGDIKPDLTFYLKLAPEIAFERKKGTNEALDRIEKEGMAFQEKVSQGYDFIAEKEKERFVIIDATKTPDEIFNVIISKINEKL